MPYESALTATPRGQSARPLLDWGKLSRAAGELVQAPGEVAGDLFLLNLPRETSLEFQMGNWDQEEGDPGVSSCARSWHQGIPAEF